MRQKFAFNLAILFGANLLVKPFWIFGIDRIVQNSLGVAQYGTFFAVFNYSLLFSVLLDLGLNSFTNRAISRDRKRLSSYFGNVFIIKIFLSAIYFIATFLSAFINGFSQEKLVLLGLLLLNQTLLTLILFFRSNLQALQLFKIDSLISVSDRVFSIAFCGAILWLGWFDLNVVNFVLAQTFALALTCVFAGLFVLSKAGFKFSFWHSKFRTKVLRSTFPYALLVFLMTVYARIDAVLLDNLLGENGAVQAGIYAASFRIFDAANQFGFLFSTILLPVFAANFKQQQSNQDLVQFSIQSILVFAVGVSVVCVVWSSFLLEMLYHQHSSEWVQVFVVTMLCFIPASVIYILGTLLTAKGIIFTLCKISAIAVFINFAINYFLIPQLGAKGSAVAALVTNLVVMALYYYTVINQTNIQLSQSFIFRLLLFIALSFLSAGLIKFFTLPEWFAIVTTGVCILVLAAILKMIAVTDITKLFKTKFS
jgi:O-antigen/teichoic acid export membrane protein